MLEGDISKTVGAMNDWLISGDGDGFRTTIIKEFHLVSGLYSPARPSAYY